MGQTPSVTEPAVATRPRYRVTLHHIECCNCKHGCNCQFTGYPNEGKCELVIGWEVIEGRFGDVALNDVRFAMAAMYPGAIHEGNGKVALFVDQAARREQVEAIGMILSGRAGGMPWEALAGTVTDFRGPITAPIEMTVDGCRSVISIPGVLQVRHEPIKDIVSGEEKEVHIVYPKGGFLWDDGSICTTATMQVDFDDIRFSHAGNYAAHAMAKWTNES